MLVLADFFESLLRGALLTSLSLVLGGVVWGLWVLRPGQGRLSSAALGRCVVLVATGAVALAACQGALLALKVFVLSETLGAGAPTAFVATVHFSAGAARALLALGLAAAALGVWRAPRARLRWAAMVVLAVLLAASGAWLTHAAGRLEARGTLMALTVLHQAAAAVWIGGVIQLVALWQLARNRPEIDALWPDVVARFSRMAAVAVLVLSLGAVPLAWTYTASAQGLVGTGYGSLVLTKVMLGGVALLLAAANRRAVRAPHRRAALHGRLPYFAEAEAIILVVVLFTAAALSGQPPAADQRSGDRATVGEVVEVFRPKLPDLRTPPVRVMRAARETVAGGAERSRDAYLWSNFSHNVAGLILLGMSLVALTAFALRAGWGRHWPLGFVGLAVFIFLRAAANEGTWPFGAVRVGQLDAEGIQHRIAAVLVLALGLLEWRARADGRWAPRLRYVFPVLCAAGALLLLTHSHTAFQLKSSFLVQVTHTTMGAFAALMVAARWLELRLAGQFARVAGAAANGAMLVIALILVFYREANVVIAAN